MKIWFLEQLAMYAAYHQDKRNQATHYVGVPMIVFAIMVGLSMIDLGEINGAPLDLALVLIAVLMLVYIVNIPLLGALATLKYGLLLIAAYMLRDATPGATIFWAIGLFVAGWAIQFWGHIYEGRKPALFDNLLQIFMAPAFLVAEALFMAGLARDLEADIEDRRQKYALGIDDESAAEQA